MLVLLFVVTTVIFAAKYLTGKIAILTVLWYLGEKGIPMPSDADLERCRHQVVKNMVRDIMGRE